MASRPTAAAIMGSPNRLDASCLSIGSPVRGAVADECGDRAQLSVALATEKEGVTAGGDDAAIGHRAHRFVLQRAGYHRGWYGAPPCPRNDGRRLHLVVADAPVATSLDHSEAHLRIVEVSDQNLRQAREGVLAVDAEKARSNDVDELHVPEKRGAHPHRVTVGHRGEHDG